MKRRRICKNDEMQKYENAQNIMRLKYSAV